MTRKCFSHTICCALVKLDDLLATTDNNMVCEVLRPEIVPHTSKVARAWSVSIISVHAGDHCQEEGQASQ